VHCLKVTGQEEREGGWCLKRKGRMPGGGLETKKRQKLFEGFRALPAKGREDR